MDRKLRLLACAADVEGELQRKTCDILEDFTSAAPRSAQRPRQILPRSFLFFWLQGVNGFDGPSSMPALDDPIADLADVLDKLEPEDALNYWMCLAKEIQELEPKLPRGLVRGRNLEAKSPIQLADRILVRF